MAKQELQRLTSAIDKVKNENKKIDVERK